MTDMLEFFRARRIMASPCALMFG